MAVSHAADHRLGVGFAPGCVWYLRDDRAYVYVPFGGGDRRDLKTGVAYRF